MEKNLLSINFFPIEKQEFQIPIYKKACENQETKAIYSFETKVFFLANKNLNDDRKKFFITFDKQEGFISDTISSLDNRSLTNWYISYLIENKCEYLNFPFKIGDKYQNVIDFLMEESELGQESICIYPTYQNKQYGVVLDYHFFANKSIQDFVEKQKKSLSLDLNGRSNRNYYGDKYDKIELFINNYFKKMFVPLDENNDISFKIQMDNLVYYSLNTKKYVFKNNETTNSQFNGMMSYGPYNAVNEECKIGFIYQENEKSLSHELYYALRGERFATFKGMERMFGLKIKKETVFGEGLSEYNDVEVERVISKILDKAENTKIIVIFIVPWDKVTANENDSKLYYYIKHKLLKNNIPCQFVNVTKIKKDGTFKWIISSIALQIFTKLGGSPWCLVPSTNNCLIIGIGQAHKKNNNIIERYYSYSIQNDSSGLFKDIKLLSDNTNCEQYLNGLSTNLREIITSQFKNFNNFVIHTSFKLRKDEMSTIKTTIEKLAGEESGKKFGVLRFNDNHYNMGFNLNNNTLTPYESSFVRISAKSYLIWFEGLQYGNSSLKERIGPPVQIYFDYPDNINYSDIQNYLQDAVNLSGANWRGFNAKSMPVSMLYAQLLSSFIASFDKYKFDDINVENITPWFL